MDDTFLLDLIEEAGGLVVADNLCYGFRHVATLVEDTGDPLESIGRRYYWNNPCPRMQGEFDRRLNETRTIARAANVDGIIFEVNPPWSQSSWKKKAYRPSFLKENICLPIAAGLKPEFRHSLKGLKGGSKNERDTP
jgi:hypothetical protein